MPALDTSAVAKADSFCIRSNQAIIKSEYLCLVLASTEMYNMLFNLIHGATRPRINTMQLKQVVIPVPSLSEQDEIVRRVGKMLAIADSIEARYNSVRQNIARTERAVYAEAFRGEL